MSEEPLAKVAKDGRIVVDPAIAVHCELRPCVLENTPSRNKGLLGVPGERLLGLAGLRRSLARSLDSRKCVKFPALGLVVQICPRFRRND